MSTESEISEFSRKRVKDKKNRSSRSRSSNSSAGTTSEMSTLGTATVVLEDDELLGSSIRINYNASLDLSSNISSGDDSSRRLNTSPSSQRLVRPTMSRDGAIHKSRIPRMGRLQRLKSAKK